jgi:hypothetical protein
MRRFAFTPPPQALPSPPRRRIRPLPRVKTDAKAAVSGSAFLHCPAAVFLPSTSPGPGVRLGAETVGGDRPPPSPADGELGGRGDAHAVDLQDEVGSLRAPGAGQEEEDERAEQRSDAGGCGHGASGRWRSRGLGSDGCRGLGRDERSVGAHGKHSVGRGRTRAQGRRCLDTPRAPGVAGARLHRQARRRRVSSSPPPP